MLIPFNRRTGAWAASICAVAALVAIAAVLLMLDRRAGGVSGEAEEQHPSSNVAVPNESLVDSSQQDDPPVTLASMSKARVEPRVACEDPLGELSEECLQSLDAYFMDRTFVWREFDWLPVPMTYRRIFTDPHQDRENVLAALERPECRLEEGEVRWDLRESCHAESFSNYAVFLYACRDAHPAYEASSENPHLLAEREREEARETMFSNYENWAWRSSKYGTHSRWVGERLLEMRWLLETACAQEDSRPLISDRTGFETLEDIGKRLGEFSEEYEDLTELMLVRGLGFSEKRWFSSDAAFDVLRAMAARLGDEWAARVYEPAAEDEEWSARQAETMPWKEYLNTMRIFNNFERIEFEPASRRGSILLEHTLGFSRISAMGENYSKTGGEARTSAVYFALGAWGELREAEMEISLDRLVEYACGPNWEKATETCQEVIARLRETETSTDQRYWHRLSEFEARAIELGLYDVAPSYRDPHWEGKELGISWPWLLDSDE